MKIRSQTLIGAAAIVLAVPPCAFAQRNNAEVQRNQPTYHLTMVPAQITAINYQHHESTEIGFQGSPILPNAKGKAKVSSRSGRIEIDAEFEHLQPASKFGPEYLTYVLWAITPEGKANNLGELLLRGDDSKIKVTTSLQTFGMIVTAEPYFAVSLPSDAVVLENVILRGTTGTIEQMSANYQHMGQGQYVYDFAHASAAYPKNPAPLELEEARNAVEIARADGAPQYAAAAFNKAETSLENADALMSHGGRHGEVIQNARDAVQNAADARNIAIQAQQEEAAAQQRAAAAQRTSEAQAAAANATAGEQMAQLARQRAELAKQEAEAQAAKDAAERAQADAQRKQAEAERAQAEAAKEQADAQAREEQQNAQAAQQQAAQAKQQAAEAERQREQLRASLLEQFNRILPTTDTPRGLKANLGDVLFATGKYDLQPAAREALAKFSGIVLAHPGLKMAVAGYTDSVGNEGYNLTLSENRANSVKAYLIDQGIDPNSITSTGYGESDPVADNGTAAGRRQNRRVEITISGEIIGTTIGGAPNNNAAPAGTAPTSPPQ